MQTSRAPLALLALLLSASPGHAGNNSPAHSPADEKAIEQVVESFRTSLINKDKPTYMGLFFSDKPEDIGWQYVSEDVRLQDIRKAKPDAIKARQIPANNFIALIDGAVASPKPKEETFSSTKIETDGDVASVSFDYSFHDDGVKTNWGKEMWQLIRTEQGWKIFSVIYSIRDSRSPAE
ncbi:nuclear transport factor 2 family protein [Stenotrophomonas maltophilia]|uniref:nuclear transport factor 2 family protein n=1 Tax=Stenotrophomonas maltophilia TaxID=40324 RepID=UPI0015DD7927|nr:nuclear transport factor 2 family protein [Stenotrophomonas maltophilia]ELN2585946.1 nuclear transport factor 2 family protein [Stenotrophomonas maltophilia]ELN2593245.1 nuclear transport factor 2 family protein [Stenotrophomonas maltophilia]MBA0297567.1 nuclear transport factor 2 family protein [Stenotrophomonas maltophilia]MBH1400833.1 nuclear transport factor 2 family protein [Stenotrophomonas maltophilia]MBH1702836.1 nuclear transport factor 2 family protein [Stenotrophomonas maltophili